MSLPLPTLLSCSAAFVVDHSKKALLIKRCPYFLLLLFIFLPSLSFSSFLTYYYSTPLNVEVEFPHILAGILVVSIFCMIFLYQINHFRCSCPFKCNIWPGIWKCSTRWCWMFRDWKKVAWMPIPPKFSWLYSFWRCWSEMCRYLKCNWINVLFLKETRSILHYLFLKTSNSSFMFLSFKSQEQLICLIGYFKSNNAVMVIFILYIILKF